jgi:fatty acid desaturase
VLRRHLHALCPDTSDGTPGMALVADREVLSASALTQIRFDAVCVIALYGTAFALYGTRWPILAALLAVRAFISSQLDHAPHHGTPLERRDHALNLSAPRWLRHVLLNFNLHRTHHQHPHLPWRALPTFADAEPGDIPFTRAVLRQWRGPIALDSRAGNASA